MDYDEPESGRTAIVKYDQAIDSDDERVCRVRGEVMGILDEMVDVNDENRGRTLKLNLDAETVTIIRKRTPEGMEDDTIVYDLVDFEMETLDNHLIHADDLYDNHERYTDDLDDMTRAIARANMALGIVHRESEANFINEYDAWRAAEVYENGIEQRIAAHNENDCGQGGARATITFPSYALAYLWVEEICGQISDGAWENEVRDWEQYYGAKVEVNESQRVVSIDGNLPNLAFHDKLLRYEGLPGRMMFYLIASGVKERVDRGEIDEMLAMRLQNGFSRGGTV